MCCIRFIIFYTVITLLLLLNGWKKPLFHNRYYADTVFVSSTSLTNFWNMSQIASGGTGCLLPLLLISPRMEVLFTVK